MICWVCGGSLTNPFHHPVEGVERTLVTGQVVRIHKICAHTFDADEHERKITAQPKDPLNPKEGVR